MYDTTRAVSARNERGVARRGRYLYVENSRARYLYASSERVIRVRNATVRTSRRAVSPRTERALQGCRIDGTIKAAQELESTSRKSIMAINYDGWWQRALRPSPPEKLLHSLRGSWSQTRRALVSLTIVRFSNRQNCSQELIITSSRIDSALPLPRNSFSASRSTVEQA
ncbi:hypothetical protein PVAR5_0624 [Paecilomyces variotii No. 5]|uniref:Uncharacterized protein n=1 Tax=Byssochlamys spectabilis (strain No. 5 / NBRC 109023) TaxID=1356009 RepID=V5FJV0_BYSSN|nr:hypothetical protein PVAR5_0624 [Paecilomyces variotii No. 5]